jgi:hypothetical protein
MSATIVMPEVELPQGVSLGNQRTYRDLAKSLGMAMKHVESVPDIIKYATTSVYSHDRENNQTFLGDMEERILLVRRLAILEDQFRVVVLDKAADREAPGYGRARIPLIFHTRLPAKPVTEIRHGDFRCNARTPHPPLEAQKALLEHGEKFDHVELWWVPKQVEVTLVKDPILAGAIAVPGGSEQREIHFEIFRWVDESVESKYWVGEGY